MAGRGHSVRFRSSGDQAGISFRVGGESISIAIIERLDAQEHVLTREEQERAERGDTRGIAKYDRVPSGRLQIIVYDATSAHSSWSDSATRRLENMLGRVVVAVEAVPERRAQHRAEEKQRRREAEVRMREAEAKKQRELEEQRRARLDAERAQDLVQRIDGYRLARDIRQYVGAMRGLVAGAGLSEPEQRPLMELMSWALAYAERVDPLTELREKIAQRER